MRVRSASEPEVIEFSFPELNHIHVHMYAQPRRKPGGRGALRQTMISLVDVVYQELQARYGGYVDIDLHEPIEKAPWVYATIVLNGVEIVQIVKGPRSPQILQESIEETIAEHYQEV